MFEDNEENNFFDMIKIPPKLFEEGKTSLS
jgi:hypothetical protein